MTIITPTQLVDEFKKSGEFDRLRRELLTQFQQSDTSGSFTSRIEDIARRLLSDQKLQYLAPDAAHKELMKEMDRYPIIERTVGELQMLADPSFVAGIQNSVQKILKEDRDKTSPPLNMDEDAKPPSIVTSQPLDGPILQSPPILAKVASSTVIQADSQSQTTTSASITVTQMSEEKVSVDTAEPLVTSDPHTLTGLVGVSDSAGGGPNSKLPSLNSSDHIDS